MSQPSLFQRIFPFSVYNRTRKKIATALARDDFDSFTTLRDSARGRPEAEAAFEPAMITTIINKLHSHSAGLQIFSLLDAIKGNPAEEACFSGEVIAQATVNSLIRAGQPVAQNVDALLYDLSTSVRNTAFRAHFEQGLDKAACIYLKDGNFDAVGTMIAILEGNPDSTPGNLDTTIFEKTAEFLRRDDSESLRRMIEITGSSRLFSRTVTDTLRGQIMRDNRTEPYNPGKALKTIEVAGALEQVVDVDTLHDLALTALGNHRRDQIRTLITLAGDDPAKSESILSAAREINAYYHKQMTGAKRAYAMRDRANSILSVIGFVTPLGGADMAADRAELQSLTQLCLNQGWLPEIVRLARLGADIFTPDAIAETVAKVVKSPLANAWYYATLRGLANNFPEWRAAFTASRCREQVIALRDARDDAALIRLYHAAGPGSIEAEMIDAMPVTTLTLPAVDLPSGTSLSLLFRHATDGAPASSVSVYSPALDYTGDIGALRTIWAVAAENDMPDCRCDLPALTKVLETVAASQDNPGAADAARAGLVALSRTPTTAPPDRNSYRRIF